MELVYLWVEKYKNIENQGFNFSPRFDCDFDGENLNIKEKEYTNIFPKNINVTAIVGENGSGKTTIQELLFLIIYLKYKALTESFAISINAVFNNLNNNIFLVLLIDNKFKIMHLKKIMLDSIIGSTNESFLKLTCDSKRFISDDVEIENIDFFSIYFNYSLDNWSPYPLYFSWIDLLYHRSDKYNKVPLLLEPDKSDGIININELTYINLQNMFKFYSELFNVNDVIKGYFFPRQIELKINFDKIEKKIRHYYSSNKNVKIKWFRYMNDIRDKKDLISLNKVYLLFKIYEYYGGTKIQENLNLLFGDEFSLSELDENPVECINKFEIENINTLDKIDNIKILNCIEFYVKMTKDNLNNYEYFMNNKNDISDVFNIYDKLLPWFNVEFYENEIIYSSLSSGEKTLLSFLINMNNQIKNIIDTDKYNTINLLFDEVELSLHPNWQKVIFNNILEFLSLFKDKKKVFNLFFITHSPFILSDLPKENVLFLKKDKKTGQCLNTTKETELTTFGANIHTLLSHGFFMKDGLMGEFSKGKIQEIKKFYELVKRFEEKDFSSPNSKSNLKHIFLEQKTKFRHIQSIIGEPFLQTIIKNYLDELEVLFNGKKQFLQDKIKRLQELESSL